MDYATLQDAVELAGTVDEVVPFGDVGRARAAMAAEGLDNARFSEPIWGVEVEPFVMIEAGLYRGIYRFLQRERLAWRWLPGERLPEPLPAYRPGELFDLALPFSSEEGASAAHGIMASFQSHGLAMYGIDQGRIDDDPLWSLRLREALARSRYMAPVVSPASLARPSGAAELLELARIGAYLRRTQHFHALIAVIEPAAGAAFARRLVGSEGPPLPAAESIERALANAFVLPLDWSQERCGAFLASLAAGARALAHGLAADTGALRMLEELVVGVALPDSDRARPWVARITLRSTLWAERQVDVEVGRDGRMLWQGTREREAVASPPGAFQHLLAQIEGAQPDH